MANWRNTSLFAVYVSAVGRPGARRLGIVCGSINDHETGDLLPSPDLVTWHCFAVAELPLLGRLFGRYDMVPALSRLNLLLKDILESEPTIKLIKQP